MPPKCSICGKYHMELCPNMDVYVKGPDGERKKLAPGGLVREWNSSFQSETEPVVQIIPMERLSQAFSAALSCNEILAFGERIKAAFRELFLRSQETVKFYAPSFKVIAENVLLTRAKWAGVSPRVIHLAKYGKTARVRKKNFKRAMREMGL